MSDVDPIVEGTGARRALIERILAEQRAWREVVDEVGMDRMDDPGPMGEWSFRDLAWHLLAWRERTIAKLEAGAAGEAMPPDPWPDGLEDDDAVNDWMQEQGRGRPASEVLAAIDASFERMANALGRFPDEQLTSPAGLPGFEDGGAASEMDWVSHWHEEHEPTVRAWLAERSTAA
jgi:hypothetical protein